MRVSSFLCLTPLAHTTLAAALGGLPDFTTTVSLHRRGFDRYGLGFLTGLDGSSTGGIPTATQAHAGETTTHTQDGLSSTISLSSPTSADPTATTESKKKAKETATLPTGTSYSVIGSLPPLEPHSTFSPAPSITPNSSSAIASGTTVRGGQSSAASGTSEWKIIGVAVIAFSTVAAILLLSVFFDQWWRFVRDVVGRRRRDHEELVPDWEKAEWELRCGQDRQRYPSFTSLPSSLPSIPIVPAPSVQSPPQAALGKRGDMHAGGRGPLRQLDRTLGARPSLSSSPRLSSSSGAGIAGLGLGSVRSVNMDGAAVSPQFGGAVGKWSSSQQHTPRLGQGYASKGGNPFDDPQSPLPDDVYAGVAN